MVLVNDKVNSIKIIQVHLSGDADADLEDLTIQADADGKEFAMLWNLGEVESIIKELPKYAQETLTKNGVVDWRDWNIFYIPTKILCISYKYGKNYKFYHLAQYFPEIENPGVEIAERCAEELEHALHLMGIWPKKLTSPAAIFEDYYGKHLGFPTFKDFTEYSGLLEYAAECAGNELTQIYTIGHFAEAFSYDRKSAYGNEMMALQDNRPKYMDIVESSEYIPEATYGYCKCIVEIESTKLLHPIMRFQNSEISEPVGSWRTYLTKGQVDFIERYKLGAVEIVNGWWLTTKIVSKPLEHIIPRVLAYKEHENPLVRDLAKWMINGFGGKFNEEYKTKVGPLYNPMWSAEIITRNAMRICSTIYQHKCWNDVISIKVDDFKLSKKLPTIPDGFKESSGECLAINAEQVFFGKQHPEGLDLKTALDMLNEHPEVGYYEKNGAIIDLWRNFPDREFRRDPNSKEPVLPKSGRDLLDNIYTSKPKYIEEA